LVDTDRVEDGGELVSVFGIVDLLRVGTKDIDTSLLESKGNVLGELA
jgi:hypothetical protein